MGWFSAALSTIGTGLGLYDAYAQRESQQDANLANYNMQKEFAQHGIQWKVEDAVRAGIHPAVALGAQTHSASPSFIGEESGVEGVGDDIQGIAENMRAREDNAVLKQIEERRAWEAVGNEKRQGMILDRQIRDLDDAYIERVEGQRDSHVLQGKPRPMYQKHQIGPGFMMYGPNLEGGESFHEAVDSMSNIAFQAMLNYNEAVQGSGWRKQFFDWYYTGVPPGIHRKGEKREGFFVP